MIFYAQRTYPNEACGFIFGDGNVQSANNIIEEMHHPGLNRKNAFLIDDQSWAMAQSSGKQIACIFHSHNDGSSDMSETDRHTLDYDMICYVIVGMQDHNPVSVKLHWWEDDILNSEEITS